MLYQAILISIALIHLPDAFGTIFTVLNATDKYAEYKAKYNKVYNSSDEEKKRYLSFINNLNAAAALNDSLKDGNIYVMNKYADLDPAEVEERYAIHLKTSKYNSSECLKYDKLNKGTCNLCISVNLVENGDHQELLRSDHGIEINNKNLYNLKNSEQLFERYIKDEKRNITKKREGFINFYRFVKTLTEKNRGIYEGNDSPDLEHTADILKESHEYFY